MRNNNSRLAALAAVAAVSMLVAGPAMAQRKSAQDQRKEQAAQIPVCQKPLGSISVLEPEASTQWWTGAQLPAPSKLIKVFVNKSRCFTLVDRGAGMSAAQYERSLAEESLLQDLDDKHVCPNCKRGVEADFVVCPHCHQQLRLRCVGCGRLLNPDWDVCPYCGTYRDQQADAKGKKQRKAAKAIPAQAQPSAVMAPSPEKESEPAAALADDDVYPTFDTRPYEGAQGELPRLEDDEVTRQLEEIAADGRALQDHLPEDASAEQTEVVEDETA